MSQWQADSFTDIVLARDKICQHCGRTELLQAHHVKHRAKGGMDDLANGICLCAGCHADEHPDLPRNLFFIKAFGPYNPDGWTATYVAGLLTCHPRSVVRHARKAGIKREGQYWAFTEDDLAVLGRQNSPAIKDSCPCQVRVSLEEKKMLEAMANAEGERQSVTLRRLIRRAYLGPGGLWRQGPPPAPPVQGKEKE